MSMQQLLLENQLCHRLYMASNLVTRAYRPLLATLDLTYPQYVVMMALWQEDNITVNELQKRTRIDSGALTLILKKMQQKSLLSLEPQPQDRRCKAVRLTSTGNNLKRQAEDIPQQVLCQFPGMTEQKLSQLKHLLDDVLLTAEAKHD